MNLRAILEDMLVKLKGTPDIPDYEGDEDRHVDDPQEEGEAT